jgi:antitoxin VapB
VDSVAINIKNEKTEQLAKKLAKLTGESMTTAITEALRERLDRVHNSQGGNPAAILLQIGKDCATHLREPFRSVDHADLLYDEKGLPR